MSINLRHLPYPGAEINNTFFRLMSFLAVWERKSFAHLKFQWRGMDQVSTPAKKPGRLCFVLFCEYLVSAPSIVIQVWPNHIRINLLVAEIFFCEF
jgi:hypothetical protein